MCGTAARHALMLVAVLAVSACSGGDEPVVTTLPAQTTQATVTSTAAPPTTPATQPPTTAPAPTTTPPTAAPTTTSGDPTFAELEEQLPPVLVAFFDTSNAAFRNPDDPALAAAVEEYAYGPALELVSGEVASLAEADKYTAVNEQEPSRVEPDLATISVSDGASAVGMDGCVIDTDFEYQRNADGTVTLLDPSPNSYRMTFTFDRIDDHWVVIDLSIFQTFAGEVGCA